MTGFDLVIAGGTVVTAADTVRCDVGVTDGRVVALGADLGGADEMIDATGKLVLPGGIDAHVHLAEDAFYGVESVVTRIYDPFRAELFGSLGLRTFNPTNIGADLAYAALQAT